MHPPAQGLEQQLGKRLNAMQRASLPAILSLDNVLVCAPTSSGKSLLFEMAILSRRPGQRFAYVAPIKCLVQQQFRDWSTKYPQLRMAELTSDSELKNSLLDYEVVLATPEKWRGRGDSRCLLLDELHLINVEGRGASLEAVVSRNLMTGTRVIAVSATVPNIQDVTEWLRVPRANLLLFGQEHRPVPLQKVVLGFKGPTNPFIFQKTLNYKLFETLAKYSTGGQTIVFCQTQKGTFSACQQIINDAPPRFFIQEEAVLQLLVLASSKVKNKQLASVLPCGVGFHHAGLDQQDRRQVQQLFTQGAVRVLCATSTLAQGVNLPARLVVVKSTYCYRGAGQGYEEYTQIQLQQMMGRAGRTGLDAQGVAVIMTYADHVKRYQHSTSRLQTLESHLKANLHETFITQIALKHLKTLDGCRLFMARSFLAVRMRRVPEMYGLAPRFTDLEGELGRTAQGVVADLVKAELVKRDGDLLYADQMGALLHKKALSFSTFRLAHESQATVSSLKEAFQLLARSYQFQKYRVKIEERKTLSALNSQNGVFKLQGAISNMERKVQVLLAAVWRGAKVQSWQLNRQSQQMSQLAARILALWLRLAQIKTNAKLYLYLAMLEKYATLGLSDFTDAGHLLAQLPGVSAAASRRMAETGVSLSDLRTMDSCRLQSIADERAPFGSELHRFLARFRLKIQISRSGKDSVIILRREVDDSTLQIVVLKAKDNPTLSKMPQGLKQVTITFSKDLAFPVEVLVIFPGFVGLDSWTRFFGYGEGQSQSVQVSVQLAKSPRGSRLSQLASRIQQGQNEEQGNEADEADPLPAQSKRRTSRPSSRRNRQLSTGIRAGPSKKRQSQVFTTRLEQCRSYIQNIKQAQTQSQEESCRPSQLQGISQSGRQSQAIQKQQQGVKLDKFVIGHSTVISRFKKSQEHYLAFLQDQNEQTQLFKQSQTQQPKGLFSQTERPSFRAFIKPEPTALKLSDADNRKQAQSSRPTFLFADSKPKPQTQQPQEQSSQQQRLQRYAALFNDYSSFLDGF